MTGFRFHNLTCGKKGEKKVWERRGKSLNQWTQLFAPLGTKQNASCKEAPICLDISEQKDKVIVKSQLVIDFKFMGETLICELEPHENAKITWAVLRSQLHKALYENLLFCIPSLYCICTLHEMCQFSALRVHGYESAEWRQASERAVSAIL